MDLEGVWELREEVIYPSLFGPVGRAIFPLTPEIFEARFGAKEIDPRWLFYGVLEYPPTAGRPCWLYVTSGYSNPWNDEPEDYDSNGDSGSGVEFIFPVSEQGDWAIKTLQAMLAFELLLSVGHFPNARLLGLNDRIPLREPINGNPGCEIRNLVVVEWEGGPKEFALPSGNVKFLGFTGITDAELVFAKTSSSEALIEKLRVLGHHPVTNPRRRSAV